MRYLYIIENRDGYRPDDRDALLKTLRSVMRVANIRIASKHVEVEIWDPDPLAAGEILRRSLGEILDVIRIDEEIQRDREDPVEIVVRYAELFNEERFWEAHGVMEILWRSSNNRIAQGLILAAASMIKIQENRAREFRELATRALEMLPGGRFFCIDLEDLRRKLLESLRSPGPFKISCARWG
jgi:predicted metal-dependent hydrolase